MGHMMHINSKMNMDGMDGCYWFLDIEMVKVTEILLKQIGSWGQNQYKDIVSPV